VTTLSEFLLAQIEENQRRTEQEMGMEHRDGIWYHDAPLPRRWHRCEPWTRGWVNYFTLIERCACGAIRHDHGRWEERNSRRAA
jgi:hypothetical protein